MPDIAAILAQGGGPDIAAIIANGGGPAEIMAALAESGVQGFPGGGQQGFPGGFSRPDMGERSIGDGFIQRRKSVDLVHWQFAGWVFDSIPDEAAEWIASHGGMRGITSATAPAIMKHDRTYRLYYCISLSARNSSYIGLAEAKSPNGPWSDKGCVIKSDASSPTSATDPTLIASEDGLYLYYGSSAGGFYVVELDPETGFRESDEDMGALVVAGRNLGGRSIEAPEIIYNPDNNYYYLFASYRDAQDRYNIRVGRATSPTGPFLDYFGRSMADSTESFPIVAAPYSYDNHEGWSGMGRCGIFRDKKGMWYLSHEGRLSPENQQMDLHVRQMFFNRDGWPLLSPERYTGSKRKSLTLEDLCGDYEIVRFEGGEQTHSKFMNIDVEDGDWTFDEGEQLLNLTLWDGSTVDGLMVFMGHDWENERETILFTGIDDKGRSLWGKRVE